MYGDSEDKLPISNTNPIFLIIHTLALFTEKRLIYICLIYKDALNDDKRRKDMRQEGKNLYRRSQKTESQLHIFSMNTTGMSSPARFPTSREK